MKTMRIQALIAFIILLLPESLCAQVEIDGIYYNVYPWDNLAGVTSNPNNYSGSIDIPSSIFYSGSTYIVFSIDDRAFSDCIDLTSVKIPNSVTRISNRAFYNCTGLTSVIIPNSVTEIYGEAFSNCHQLTSVVIPNSVTEIGGLAFSECYDFTSLVIPNSVTSIGGRAFEGTGLTTITINREIPPSIQSYSFDDYVTSNCTLYVPAGSRSAYERAEGWNEFEIIKESAFSSDGLDVLATGAYENLSYTIYSDMTMVISGIGAMQEDYFQIKDIIDIEKYQGVKKVFIEDGVTSITGNVISDCIGLTSVIIPSSVTEIGISAFYNCTDLTSLIVGWTDPLAIGPVFGDVNKSSCTLYVPSGSKSAYESASGWNEFQNIVEYTSGLEVLATGSCGENDVTYTIYSDMTMVISGTGNMDMLLFADHPTYDGYCHSIKKVIIEEGVSGIGPYAFNECTGMISVTIPSTVNEIFTTPFAGSISLTTMTVASGNTTYDSRDNCNAIIETSTNTLIAGCKNSIIPNSVTSIGDGAFISCTGLTSVTIPNSVTSIGKNAFSACSGLTTINIPNSVTSIGRGAFNNCTGLTSVTVEGETPASVGNDSFYNVDKTNCILYVPTGSKTAYESAEGWSEFQNIVELGEESDTDISVLDNAIYLEQVESRIGVTMDIPVMLKNSYPVRGFIFTMELPEGSTINSWEPSTNRLPSGATLSDMFSPAKIDGNKINVACTLNYGNATFTGNDGEIGTVNVTFANDMEVGEYPIYLTACDISDAGGTDKKLADIKATLVLEDYVVGDANSDGEVLIGDVITILNYIVGVTSENFNEKAADANGDGEILIGDVIAVLNIIVSQ